jgi:hypothetical protein
MKKAIFKLLLVLGLFAGIDRSAGLLLDYLRDHSPDGRYYKTNYSLNKCREDVIVIGSSRAEINLVSQVVEDSLNLSCWNAGRGGQGLPYFRAIQEAILGRYTPKIAILNVDDSILETPIPYEHVGFLRPYYHDHAVIRPMLNKISAAERYLLNSRLYAYNSSYYYLIRPYFIPNLDGKTTDKGWKPRLNKMEADMTKTLEIVKEYTPLDSVAAFEFDVLVQKFREKNVQVILVVSPNYGRSVTNSPTIRRLQDLSKSYDLPLYVFSDDKNYVTNPGYFVDPDHLNTDGAHHFTADLMRRVKPQLLPRLTQTNRDQKISEAR